MLIWVELDGGVCYELGDDSFLLISESPGQRFGCHDESRLGDRTGKEAKERR